MSFARFFVWLGVLSLALVLTWQALGRDSRREVRAEPGVSLRMDVELIEPGGELTTRQVRIEP